jgi:hypothetical protein
LPRAFARAAGLVDQVQLGLCQFGAVALELQVEVDAGDVFCSLQRQCGFAGLARPEQGYSREALDFLHQLGKNFAGKHPCNYGVPFHDL